MVASVCYTLPRKSFWNRLQGKTNQSEAAKERNIHFIFFLQKVCVCVCVCVCEKRQKKKQIVPIFLYFGNPSKGRPRPPPGGWHEDISISQKDWMLKIVFLIFWERKDFNLGSCKK